MNNFISLIVTFIILFHPMPIHATYGNYGDLMLLYSANPIEDSTGIKAEREVRDYEEALLNLGIPQYIADNNGKVHDESLVRGEFFYHTEIVSDPHEYERFWGMDWRRYKFTDYAKQILWVGQVVAIHKWIVVDNVERYKLPLEETRQMYIDYLNDTLVKTQIPVTLMIGSEYGQTLEDYTDFSHFYWKFMRKHHYCITATFWSILKSCYDRGDDEYKQIVEEALQDPRRVQSFDTLTAGRLIGMLLDCELIEEY